VNRNDKQTIIFGLLAACMIIVVLTLVIILGSIIINGLPMISWDFLTKSPEIDSTGAQTEGGIWGPLVGTFYLMLLVLGIAIPIGILGTIFLVEYLGKYSWNRILWIIVNNLAGVPSIVYGLLGVALFVGYLQFGLSLIAAGLTLGLMILPVTMVATREALEAVPPSLRDASIALGATRLQTIRHHTIPYSMSGILTGIILSLSRVAGETAPILVTGVVASSAIPDSLFAPFQAMPYYIYILVTQTANVDRAYAVAWGVALVLVALVVGMNLVAIIIRKRYREKYKW
jgi:phosphate transport system permease protein